MIVAANGSSLVKNTAHQVVLPFYVYAAACFIAATVLMFISAPAFTQHYFQPQTLAITHIMALGWGTMVILGAAHQLFPVLIEAKLFSNFLAYTTFILAAAGIPLLVVSFYRFQFGTAAITGAVLVNSAVAFYLLNLVMSMRKGSKKNVHAVFALMAGFWLLATTVAGLLLVCNFRHPFLPENSLHYLSLHAHIGIIGWFLLLVVGVGSRLIPMFLISKYNEPKKLWIIFLLINAGLIIFIMLFFAGVKTLWFIIPAVLILAALALFGHYCYNAYRQRIRKKVDAQMKISLLSVGLMLLPLVLLIVLILLLLFANVHTRLVLLYGFFIFFGWITAIILGMTFKTLPFIVWNKSYHNRAGAGNTPNPKELFSAAVFSGMSISYATGFVMFATGILLAHVLMLQIATVFLLITAVLYNWNVFKMLLHKPTLL